MLKQDQTLAKFNQTNYKFSTRTYNNLTHKDRLRVIELCDLWFENDPALAWLSIRFNIKKKKVRSVLRWFENEMKRYQELSKYKQAA